jgi:peptidyl-prolyl cis-trans isomerase D
MFDFVRTHNRLLQFVLLLVVFPSFVFFGVQGYSRFVDSSAKTVARVDGADIKLPELEAAHRQQIERMSQQMPGVDVKLLETPAMKQQTLDELVRERVLLEASVKDHLAVGDERLQRLFRTDPQYAAVRRPDGTVNTEMLAAQGMSSAAFAERLRQDYAMRQVLGGVTDSVALGGVIENDAVDALLQRREAQLQTFDPKDSLDKVHPSDAEVQAYYQAYTAQFRSPERATIEYVALDLDALKSQINVSEDDLAKYYKENLSRYTQAEERQASHILINASKDEPAATREKAKARAEALLAEVRKNPDSFAEVARKNSQDTGSATRGGDLGWFARGAMVKPFEDAAFSMKSGEISNLVESEFGFHIIKLTGVRGGEVQPLEKVRAQILDEIRKQLAQKRYAELAEQFSTMVYDQPDSLQPVIDKLKLAKQGAVVGRTPAPGAKGPLASAKLLEAIFANDALKNKHNTEAIETGPSQLVSARVTAYQPEAVQPLEAVRAQVLAQLRDEQAAAAARKDGEALLAALRKDATLALPRTLTLSRTHTESQPRQVVDAVLRADLTHAPAAVGVDLGARGYVVAKVIKVVPRDASDADTAQAQPFVRQALADAEAQAYYATLKKRFKVEVHPDLIPSGDSGAGK